MDAAQQFLQYAALRQANSQQLGQDIGGAIDLYKTLKMKKDAEIAAAREKELLRQQQAAEKAMKPEAIYAKAIQFGADALTPEERAAFEAFQGMKAAEVGVDQFGQTYRKYMPLELGGQQQSIAPVGQPIIPQSIPQQAVPQQIMHQQPVMPQQVKAEPPSPSGFAEERTVKYKAPASSSPIAKTPVGQMKAYERELQFYADKLMRDYEKGLDKEADDKARNLIDKNLKRMSEINEKLKERNAVMSEDNSMMQNVGIMAVDAPIVGGLVEGMSDPKTRELRTEYENLRAMLFPFYAKASGLAATAIDTEAARKQIMDAMGSPTGYYEANKKALEAVSNSIGKGAIKSTTKSFREGQTATNPTTGEKMIFRGGKWQKM